ncbi:TldD/PmbA family protein [Breoghania sp. L-A4]|uniref:TldD/PmbA family protein n=1 Tax=Breoghania sp. L-A4 TaxID=2304600 RepID=UPI000E35E6FA|nr:TldD/PmbA family protein [Breoghania sp. L-A4]AXS39470.1 TldD/PmbA family protein [Breoghania sp. L-A4]
MTAHIDQAALEAQAARLVEAARAAGADAADAVAITGVSLGVDVRNGVVEETNRSESDDFTLRVFIGQSQASVSANVFDDPATLAERAVAMARVAPPDRFAGLADPALLARTFPELDLVDETPVDADMLRDVALACEAAALDVSGVSKSGGASASWGLAGVVLATSGGFTGSYMVSRSGFSATAVAGEGTLMERDYDFDHRTHRADLDDPSAVGRRAGERAVRRLNPQKITTRTTNVFYEPRAARSLLGHFAGAINGASIARGTSFLKSKMDQRIFAPGITITDDPLRPRALGSRAFDGEGVAVAPLTMVEDGILRCWFLDSPVARELGLITNGRASRGGSGTSPGSTNLTLAPGEIAPEDLLREIGEGIYVTDLIGHGVNGLTGDYSRGVSGFWIENGELTYPVSEVTVAGNLIDMFARLRPASDLDDRFSTSTPSIAIEGLTLAGR